MRQPENQRCSEDDDAARNGCPLCNLTPHQAKELATRLEKDLEMIADQPSMTWEEFLHWLENN